MFLNKKIVLINSATAVEPWLNPCILNDTIFRHLGRLLNTLLIAIVRVDLDYRVIDRDCQDCLIVDHVFNARSWLTSDDHQRLRQLQPHRRPDRLHDAVCRLVPEAVTVAYGTTLRSWSSSAICSDPTCDLDPPPKCINEKPSDQ